VIHQENLGLSGARNTGLDRASGDLIAFLDPDDAFCGDMIRALQEAMESHHADIVLTGFTSVHTIGPLCETKPKYVFQYHEELLTSDQALVRLVIYGSIVHSVWNKLYKRELWNGIRFPVGAVYEDISTTYQVFSRADCILTLPGTQVIRRIRPGSITWTNTLKNIQDLVKALIRLESFAEKNTPGLFDSRQLNYLREKSMKRIILKWRLIPPREYKNAADVREFVINSGKAMGPENMSFLTRAEYTVFRFCPLLASVTLFVCRHFRKFGRRIVRIIRHRKETRSIPMAPDRPKAG
jgi:glycosyltransferase involved in cell wall biosynthesis